MTNKDRLARYCRSSKGKYHYFLEIDGDKFKLTLYCEDGETLVRDGSNYTLDGGCRDLLWLVCQKDGVSMSEVVKDEEEGY